VIALALILLALAVPLAAEPARLSVVGSSMVPTLRDGDTITVQAVPFSEIRVGDVIVFRDPHGARVVHRVREIRRGRLWTKGDANARRDAFWVTREMYLGKAHE